MKKKWIIDVDKIPENQTVEKYIRLNTDINHYIDIFNKNSYPDYQKEILHFDIKNAQSQIKKLMEHYGNFSFEYFKRENKFESYRSTSLTSNPKAIDALSSNPHQSALGSSLYESGSSMDYESRDALKNSYADTYSFNTLNTICSEIAIHQLIESFQRTLIRSRISLIKANAKESMELKYLWHQDESIFLNLRVNIPIISNENYVIQFIEDEQSETGISEFTLTPGHAYIYNTQKFHRPFCKELNDQDRINIICGVSPWFDFNREENIWESNDFYGEIHPFEMFKNAMISRLIGTKL